MKKKKYIKKFGVQEKKPYLCSDFYGMSIIDNIRDRFRKGSNVLINSAFVPFGYGLTCHQFGIVIFQNIVELLTDICNDVTLKNKEPQKNVYEFAQFKAFFDAWGKYVMTKLFFDGYVVIGRSVAGYRILVENKDYRRLQPKADVTIVEAIDPNVEVYVMKSECWNLWQTSDKAFVQPFIEYIDNVLNASNTASARLGNLVVASPKNVQNAPTAFVLNKEQKDELEKELEKEYGALKEQKQMLLLPREMAFQVISLAGVDMKTAEKVRLGILAIVDRVKVSANQVAIIDSNSSKSLSNGSELREGDFSKYQSFERYLNQTFIRFADAVGLKVDYTIYNKPSRITETEEVVQ